MFWMLNQLRMQQNLSLSDTVLYHCVFPTLVGSWPHYPAVWGFWHVWTPGSPPPRIQAPASCKLMVHWGLRHRRWSPGRQMKQHETELTWVWLTSCCKYIENLSVFLVGHLWDIRVYFYYRRTITLLSMNLKCNSSVAGNRKDNHGQARSRIGRQSGSVLLLQCRNKPCKTFWNKQSPVTPQFVHSQH